MGFQEGRPEHQETRRRSQERVEQPLLDDRLLQEKEANLTSLLQEAKIISQESDHVQVSRREMCLFFLIRMKISFP